MTINLAELNTAEACDATFDLELKHPVSKELTGLIIRHKGVNAREVQAVSRKAVNQLIARNFKAQRKGEDDNTPTVEEGERRAAKILVAATVGWFEITRNAKGEVTKTTEGFPFGKERLLFTPEAAEKLYSDLGFDWLREQLDASVGDLGNFMKK